MSSPLLQVCKILWYCYTQMLCTTTALSDLYLFFYRDCLRDHILAFRDADVLCPCNEEFDCKGTVTELEMRAVCVPAIV